MADIAPGEDDPARRSGSMRRTNVRPSDRLARSRFPDNAGRSHPSAIVKLNAFQDLDARRRTEQGLPRHVGQRQTQLVDREQRRQLMPIGFQRQAASVSATSRASSAISSGDAGLQRLLRPVIARRRGDQGPRIGMLRLGEELGDARLLHDLAGIEHASPAGRAWRRRRDCG